MHHGLAAGRRQDWPTEIGSKLTPGDLPSNTSSLSLHSSKFCGRIDLGGMKRSAFREGTLFWGEGDPKGEHRAERDFGRQLLLERCRCRRGLDELGHGKEVQSLHRRLLSEDTQLLLLAH